MRDAWLGRGRVDAIAKALVGGGDNKELGGLVGRDIDEQLCLLLL